MPKVKVRDVRVILTALEGINFIVVKVDCAGIFRVIFFYIENGTIISTSKWFSLHKSRFTCSINCSSHRNLF